MSTVLETLVQQILGLAPDPLDVVKPFWAKVQAVNSGPASVNIRINGSSTVISGVRYAATYSPTVGDTVYGRLMGTDPLVDGKAAT